jgi:hypothetical protein
MGYYHLLSATAIDTGDDNLRVVPIGLRQDQRVAAHTFSAATMWAGWYTHSPRVPDKNDIVTDEVAIFVAALEILGLSALDHHIGGSCSRPQQACPRACEYIRQPGPVVGQHVDEMRAIRKAGGSERNVRRSTHQWRRMDRKRLRSCYGPMSGFGATSPFTRALMKVGSPPFCGPRLLRRAPSAPSGTKSPPTPASLERLP